MVRALIAGSDMPMFWEMTARKIRGWEGDRKKNKEEKKTKQRAQRKQTDESSRDKKYQICKRLFIDLNEH